jgi:hypothetical protein
MNIKWEREKKMKKDHRCQTRSLLATHDDQEWRGHQDNLKAAPKAIVLQSNTIARTVQITQE